MRVTLFSAASLNGFIARENGDEDFLSHAHWQTVEGLAREMHNFIIGRRTYEAVQNWGERYNFETLKGVQSRVVLSREMQDAPKGFTLCRTPQEGIEALRKVGHQRALVVGGSSTNASFLAAGLIDEIIVNIEPVAIPRGIPFFAPSIPDIELAFLKANPIGGGIIQLQYKVIR